MLAHTPTRRGRTVEIRFDTDAGTPLVATFDLPPHVAAGVAEGATEGPADAALAAGWLPAMARREALSVTGSLSPRLRRGAERIADILLTWDRALHPESQWYGRVALAADSTTAATIDGTDGVGSSSRPRQTACFFTGGVDSFHTVARHRDEIDELVFVHGFDLLDDRHHPLNREVSARLRDAAQELGLPLIELQCNLVAFAAASGIGWDDYHGAAMATVAHLLAPRYSTVYVPATTTYDQLYPLGSHPLLDPLWSSERVEIIHDGADCTRIEKLAALAGVPAARRHLRVCTENRGDAYNCGECEKCIRTAVGVRIAGVEGAFTSLRSPSLREIATVDIRGLGSTWRSYLAHLEHSGASPRLRWAITTALARAEVRRHVRRWTR